MYSEYMNDEMDFLIVEYRCSCGNTWQENYHFSNSSDIKFFYHDNLVKITKCSACEKIDKNINIISASVNNIEKSDIILPFLAMGVSKIEFF